MHWRSGYAPRAAILGTLMLVITSGDSPADETQPADIATVMHKSFDRDSGYKFTIPAAVKANKWDDATRLAKEWVELASALVRNKPPRGEAKEWEAQCATFEANTKAVLTACEQKNPRAVNRAIGSYACGACHRAHKG